MLSSAEPLRTSSGLKTFRAKVKGKLFKFLVSRNVAEQTVPATFVYLCISVQHIIQCVNTLHLSYVEKILGSAVETYRREFLYIGLPYLFIVILLHVIMLLMSKTRSKIVGMLEFSIYMTIAFTYIVYPFGVYAFALTLAQLFDAKIDPNTLSLTGMSCFFVFGALFISLSLRFRNEIQCKSILSTVSCSTEIISYFLTIINQFIFVIRRQDSVIGVGSLVLGIVKLLIFFICIYSSSVNLFFWDLNLNIHYSKWQLRVVIICILSEIYEVNFTASAFMILIISQALTSKLVQTITSTAVKINFMAPSITPRKVLIGVVFMEKYTRVESSTKLSPIEIDLFFFYTGLWQSNYHKIKLEDRCVVRPKQQNDIGFNRSMLLELLISFLKTLDHSSPVILKLIMKLQVIQVLPYLKSIRQTYERLKKVNGDGLLGEFDTFHYRKLLESKLDALYKGKIKDDEFMAFGLEGTYEPLTNYLTDFSFSHKISKYMSEDYVDLSRVFEEKDHFIDLGSQICLLLDRQGDLFESVSSGHSSGSSASAVIQLNRLIRDSKAEVKRRIDMCFHRNTLEGMMSYYYPTLIFYFSLIRYDIELTDRLMHFYKKKLMNLSLSKTSKNHFRLMKIEAVGVTLQASLDQESLGVITQASLNYQEVLRKPSSGSIIGKNINGLLPQKMAKLHKYKLNGLESSSNLDAHTDMVMLDLRANLLEAKGLVKIMPTIDTGINSLTLIVAEQKQREALLMLDGDFRIMAANERATSMFDLNKHRSKNSVDFDLNLDIQHVSSQLKNCLKLLKLLTKLEEESNVDQYITKNRLLNTESTSTSKLIEILTDLKQALSLENPAQELKFSVDWYGKSKRPEDLPKKNSSMLKVRYMKTYKLNVLVYLIYIEAPRGHKIGTAKTVDSRIDRECTINIFDDQIDNENAGDISRCSATEFKISGTENGTNQNSENNTMNADANNKYLSNISDFDNFACNALITLYEFIEGSKSSSNKDRPTGSPRNVVTSYFKREPLYVQEIISTLSELVTEDNTKYSLYKETHHVTDDGYAVCLLPKRPKKTTLLTSSKTIGQANEEQVVATDINGKKNLEKKQPSRVSSVTGVEETITEINNDSPIKATPNTAKDSSKIVVDESTLNNLPLNHASKEPSPANKNRNQQSSTKKRETNPSSKNLMDARKSGRDGIITSTKRKLSIANYFTNQAITAINASTKNKPSMVTLPKEHVANSLVMKNEALLSSNIFIATFSAISILYNQVIKQEYTSQYIRSQGASETSVAISRGSQGRYLVKKFGNTFSKSPRLRYYQYVLAGFCLIMSTGFICHLGLTYVISQYLQTSIYLFSLSHLISCSNIEMRSGLQLYMERQFLLTNLLTAETTTSVSGGGFTQGGSGSSGGSGGFNSTANNLNRSTIVHNASRDTYRTLSYMDKISEELAIYDDQITKTIQDLAFLTPSPLVREKTRSSLFSKRIPFERYRRYLNSRVTTTTVEHMSILTFFRNFQTAVQAMSATTKGIAMYTKNPKGPKFNIPPRVMETLYTSLTQNRQSVVQGIFAQVLGFIEDLTDELMGKFPIVEKAVFLWKYISLQIVSLVLILVYIVFQFWSQLKIKNYIFKILSVPYKILTLEEASLHYSIYRDRSRFLDSNLFNESNIINQYFSSITLGVVTNHLGRKTAQFKRITEKKLSEIGVSQYSRQKRAESRSGLFTFRSVWIMILGSLVIGMANLCYQLFFMLQYKSIEGAINKFMYYNTIQKQLTQVSDDYLYSTLFLVYGDSMKVGTRNITDVLLDLKDVDPAKDFVSTVLSVRNQMHDLIIPSLAATADTLLFTDVCTGVSTPLCSLDLSAKKGYLAYLITIEEFLTDMRTASTQSEAQGGGGGANRTRNAVPNSILWYFTPANMAKCIVFRETYAAVGLILSDGMGIGLLDSLEAINERLSSFSQLFSFLSVIAVALLFMVFYTFTLRSDLEIATQSITNLLPETLSQNKLLQSIVDKTFPFQ